MWTDTFHCKITVTINYVNKNQFSFNNKNNNLNQWNAVEVNSVGRIAHLGDCCNTFYGIIYKDSLKITNSLLQNVARLQYFIIMYTMLKHS